MKVVHLNTITSGGAANAAINLHLTLLKKGVDSHFLYLMPDAPSIPIPKSVLYKPGNLLERVSNSILYRRQKNKYKWVKQFKPAGASFHALSAPYIYLHEHPLLVEADIINLHWISGFVDYSTFFSKIKKPIVWSLHDENPYLGGFHYEFEFNETNNVQVMALEERLKERKKYLLSESELYIVGISEWIHNKAKTSKVLMDKQHFLIPNGVNIDIFRPLDKILLRQKYNIPSDKFVLLFVADQMSDLRKGMKYLLSAFQLVQQGSEDDIILCSVGKGSLGITESSYVNFGYVSKKEKLAELYSLADVFVIPSLADNLPNTVLESLACGTPVIGSEIGGIPDMVFDQRTGCLFEPGNSNSLVSKIKFAKENKNIFDKRRAEVADLCRGRFSLETQAEKYIELYNIISH